LVEAAKVAQVEQDQLMKMGTSANSMQSINQPINQASKQPSFDCVSVHLTAQRRLKLAESCIVNRQSGIVRDDMEMDRAVNDDEFDDGELELAPGGRSHLARSGAFG
jgi:hypothetical protein